MAQDPVLSLNMELPHSVSSQKETRRRPSSTVAIIAALSLTLIMCLDLSGITSNTGVSWRRLQEVEGTLDYIATSEFELCVDGTLTREQVQRGVLGALNLTDPKAVSKPWGDVSLAPEPTQCTAVAPAFAGQQWHISVYNAPPAAPPQTAADLAIAKSAAVQAPGFGAAVAQAAAVGAAAPAISAVAAGYVLQFPPPTGPTAVQPATPSGYYNVLGTPQYLPLWAWASAIGALVLFCLLPLLCLILARHRRQARAAKTIGRTIISPKTPHPGPWLDPESQTRQMGENVNGDAPAWGADGKFIAEFKKPSSPPLAGNGTVCKDTLCITILFVMILCVCTWCTGTWVLKKQ
jgi:hypothetical protein